MTLTSEQQTKEVSDMVEAINTHLKSKRYKPFDFVSISYNAALMVLAQAMCQIKDKQTFDFMMQSIPSKIIETLNMNEKLREQKANGEAKKIILDS